MAHIILCQRHTRQRISNWNHCLPQYCCHCLPQYCHHCLPQYCHQSPTLLPLLPRPILPLPILPASVHPILPASPPPILPPLEFLLLFVLQRCSVARILSMESIFCCNNLSKEFFSNTRSREYTKLQKAKSLCIRDVRRISY